MNRKELITELVKAGFTIEEALKTAADPLEETETEQPDEDQEEPQTDAEDHEEAAPESVPDMGAILKAIDELRETVKSMTEVTRATARLYSASEKKTESADDILSRLG